MEKGLDGGEEISVDVLNRENTHKVSISAKFVAKDGDGKATYEYSIWAGLGDDLVFIPRDSRYFCIMLLLVLKNKFKFFAKDTAITCFNKK